MARGRITDLANLQARRKKTAISRLVCPRMAMGDIRFAALAGGTRLVSIVPIYGVCVCVRIPGMMGMANC